MKKLENVTRDLLFQFKNAKRGQQLDLEFQDILIKNILQELTVRVRMAVQNIHL